jgi:Domain of unknown function (DUF1707)
VTAGPGDEMAAGAGDRGDLRASHADREQVISVLKAAFVQGMVDKDEFDLRVGQAYASRTCAELAAVTADIPAGLVTAKPPAPARARGEQPVLRPGPVIVAATAAYAGWLVYVAFFSKGGDGPVKGPLVFVGFFVYLIVLALCVGQVVALRRGERSGGQSPWRPAAGAGGQASQRLPSADPGGQLPPVDHGHQHTAEAAQRPLPCLALPGSRSLRRWHLRKLLTATAGSG